MSYTKPKGTYDIYNQELLKFNKMVEVIKQTCELYNYLPIRTPLFESSEVFHRNSENSDMVKKETYDFLDKGNRKLTLRPEGTAGVTRAFIENKLYVEKPYNKFYYVGSYYRYERPQKGRFREFYQFGVEVYGNKNHYVDFEAIKLLSDICKNLGLNNLIVHINSLGDKESKQNYNKKLYDYFSKYQNNLCEDCQNRLENNTLRILDCKICNEKEFFHKSPKSIESLSNESKIYFDKVIELLNKFEIKYKIDNYLVRGLDYYSEIVYELKASSGKDSLYNTIGGGGRYDNLVHELGGPELSGVGFAIGLERLFNVINENNTNLDVHSLDAYLLCLNNNQDKGFNIYFDLINNKISSAYNYDSQSFKATLKKALNENPKYLLFYGETEEKENFVLVKDTKTQNQEKVEIKNLVEYLKDRI